MDKRGAAIFLALAVSCVPSTEPSDPRGAVALSAEPSAGTRGEPFLTKDGYRVRIDHTVLIATMRARVVDVANAIAEGGVYGWNGNEPRELLLPAIPARAVTVQTDLGEGRALPIGPGGEVGFSIEFFENLGMTADDATRLGRPGDGWEDTLQRPSLIVAGRAEKDGRVVSFDLALIAIPKRGGAPSGATHTVDVRADAAVSTRMEVVVENLFATFQDFADADQAGDGNGIVTGPELRQHETTCSDCDDPEAMLPVLERVAFEAGKILVAR